MATQLIRNKNLGLFSTISERVINILFSPWWARPESTLSCGRVAVERAKGRQTGRQDERKEEGRRLRSGESKPWLDGCGLYKKGECEAFPIRET